jgi:murein DD-endopeptidase MepM/ murein hydrolase activator NlpD
MTFILKIIVRFLPVIILFIAATSLLSLRSCADGVGATVGGGGEAQNVNCVEAGVLDPANPFTGWPAAGGANWGYTTATFCDPVYLANLGSIHYGLDLGYPAGHGVLASAEGTIARAEMGHESMGNNIQLCHPDGYCAIYMHLISLDVGVGETVFTGQQIGTVGSTGNSTGPHLHFQVTNPAGLAIDPAPSL